MLFSSISFIYVFLPAVCFLYLITRKELHNPILLIASIIFYAWGEPRYLAIMLVTIMVNYLGALLIEKYPLKKKLTLTLTIAANLGFLIYFKYFNFILGNINALLHTNIDFIKVVMPIGISFYTFQAMSYLIDVYRGECKAQKDIYKLALYICLFPQLIAGPIVKYHDVAEQIDSREVNFEKVDIGVKRFIIGLAKKMLIANTMGAIADKIFVQAPDTFTPLVAWIGSFAYSLQLFYDFSGYSDMAIGLGLIFGFRFMENFNYPYISKSITEFWRRWHISLSTWFRQYVYIPLGGNKISPNRTYINLAVVFFLTGLWHGASWNFIFWGLWNGFFIILEKMTGWHKETDKPFINFLKHIYTIFIFVLGWVMFRADNMHYAAIYLKNMFGLVKVHDIAYGISYYGDTVEILTFIIALICATPVFSKILEIKQERKILRSIVNIWLIILFILSTAAVAASTYNPFIYFRF
ncbi:uncharacterized protein BN676_01636 [Brachyspira sp. CAG:484]|nr:uncharacterized protein BN676_01636 [Brachyspira sp. CAG:484]